MYREGWNLSYPIIELNSTDKLYFGFDLVNADYQTFTYKIVHCQPNGEPSGLIFSEFANGFENLNINDFNYSQNSLTPYIHYSLSIPNPQCNILLAGRYELQVFVQNDDTPILKQSFYVVNSQVGISGKIIRPTVPNKILTHQQVAIELSSLGRTELRNPAEWMVNVMQNGRTDASGYSSNPDFIASNKFSYIYTPEFLFPGGTEFLHFDTRVITYKEMETDSILYQDGMYHFFLHADFIHPYTKYAYEPDLNGAWQLPPDSYMHSPLDVDYVDVTFRLQHNSMSDVYVLGHFNHFAQNQHSKMYRTQEADGYNYELTLKLKQGYFNYTYSSDQIPQFFETENDYLIFIYRFMRNLNAWEIAGFHILNSVKNR